MGHPDPCKESRASTLVAYEGGVRRETVQRQVEEGKPSIDCFYVYPTVAIQSQAYAFEQ